MKPRYLIVLAASFLALLGSKATRAAERAIDKSVVVNATLDQAWDAWTTREGIVSFFAPDAKIEARVGGPFQIYFDPLGKPGNKGADDMRFLALQPKKMISFDWNAPPHLAEARQQRTFVVVRFDPVSATQTKVTLHHTGWGDGGEWDKAHEYFDKAWANVLTSLQKRFVDGHKDWSEWMAQLKARDEAKDSKPPATK